MILKPQIRIPEGQVYNPDAVPDLTAFMRGVTAVRPIILFPCPTTHNVLNLLYQMLCPYSLLMTCNARLLS